MMRHSEWYHIQGIILVVIFFLSACGGDKELGLSLEEEFLEEGVPFDKLGSGKIVFDREGHVYVIDVAKGEKSNKEK